MVDARATCELEPRRSGATITIGVTATPVVRLAHDRYFRTDHLMADLRGRSVRGGAVTLSAQAVKFVLQLGSTALLARLLTPADFGLVAMVAAFTGFVSLFKDLGLSMATVQRAEITHEQVSILFWINVALSMLLMGVAAAIAPAVAWFYGEPRLTWIMLAVAGTFIFGGLSAQHIALLRRQMRFAALAAIEIGSMTAGIAVAILMAWRGFGYWSLVAMGAASVAATMGLCWALSGWSPGWPSRHSGVMPMLKFGGHLTGFNLLNYANRNADNVLIGWGLGAGLLGIYSKAYALLLLPILQLNAPIAAVALPALSRLQSEPRRYRRYYLQALQIMVVAGIPLVAFAFSDAELLIQCVLGDQWLAAVPVFRCLAPAAFFGTFNIAAGWVFVSLGRSDRLLRWGLISTPVTLLGFLIGLQWGVLGVAAAFSLTYCALQPFMIAYAYRSSPLRMTDLIQVLWRPALMSAIAGLALWILPTDVLHISSGVRLLMDAAIFAGCFLAAALLTPGGIALLQQVSAQVVSLVSRREDRPQDQLAAGSLCHRVTQSRSRRS
jgi:O-antigen/teichoic acid export membrane protein